jgi:hypothetical protein
MGGKVFPIGAVLLCLLAAVAACGSHSLLEQGCQPPPHEDALLAAFQAEPVFRFVPPQATMLGRPTAEKGCHQLTGKVTMHGKDWDTDEGETATKVEVTFNLGVSFGQDQLASMYDADIRARGWKPQEAQFPSTIPGDYQAGLNYCQDIDGVPSFLWIDERWTGPSQGTAPRGSAAPSPTTPFDSAGSIQVTINAQTGVHCL